MRLSEDGHLVFSLKDEDVPVYNFGPHFDYADTVDTNYILKHKKHVRYDYRFNFLNTGFVGSRYARYIGIEQVLPPDLVFFILYDETGVRNPAPVPVYHASFTSGFGLGAFQTVLHGTSLWGIMFENRITPVSATISGEYYPAPELEIYRQTSVEEKSWGQLKKFLSK